MGGALRVKGRKGLLFLKKKKQKDFYPFAPGPLVSATVVETAKG